MICTSLGACMKINFTLPKHNILKIDETKEQTLSRKTSFRVWVLTLFRMGFFGTAYGCGGRGIKRPPFPNIFHIYSIMMKLGTVMIYLMKIWKIYKSCDTPLEFCWHQYFSLESKFCYIKKYRYRLNFDT